MSAAWSDLTSPFMEAVLRADANHDGQPIFDVVNRRRKSVLGMACWYRPWRRLGVRVVKVSRVGCRGQHIDLCGKPLAKAIQECRSPCFPCLRGEEGKK